MRVGLIQSSYIPWKGYFDIIHDVDLFIFFDGRQYTRNDWRNRNRIKSSEGTRWLTIPVGSVHRCIIDDVRLPPSADWARYHFERLEKSYGRAPFFGFYRDFFREIYLGRHWTRLAELNQATTCAIARDLLGIKTQFITDHEFRGLTEAKGGLVLKMMELVGARTYVSGPSARNYLNPSAFADAGIELVWKDYAGYPDYPQLHPPLRTRDLDS